MMDTFQKSGFCRPSYAANSFDVGQVKHFGGDGLRHMCICTLTHAHMLTYKHKFIANAVNQLANEANRVTYKLNYADAHFNQPKSNRMRAVLQPSSYCDHTSVTACIVSVSSNCYNLHLPHNPVH